MPAAAVDPFADLGPDNLIGGEDGAPAFQTVGGRFEQVPRAEVNTPTELGAFADLIPNTNSASNGNELVSGPFDDLVPKPQTETEKALADTPGLFDAEMTGQEQERLKTWKPGQIKPGSTIDRLVTWFGGGEQALLEAEKKMEAGVITPGERPPGAMMVAKGIDTVTGKFGVPPVLQDLVETTTREPGPDETSFLNLGIPHVPPQEGTAKQIAAGVANVPIGFANFLLSPGGIATLQGVGLLPKLGQKLVGLGFTAEQVKAFFDAKSLQDKVTSAVGATFLGWGTYRQFALDRAAKAQQREQEASASPASEPEAPVAPTERPAPETPGQPALPVTPLEARPEQRMAPPIEELPKTEGEPNAVPIRSAESEIPRTLETGQDQPGISRENRPGESVDPAEASRAEIPAAPETVGNAAEAIAGNKAVVAFGEFQGSIAPGGQSLSALPPAAATRPIKSQRQIITDLAKGLNVPIRFGRLRTNKFAGYFMPKSDLIGSKKANDLTTVTHEVGHKLDREFSFSGDSAIQAELNVLGDPATPGSLSSWTKSKPLKYKHGEGIAEFVRHWLTDPKKAAKDAPATHSAFEKILDANKDVGDVLRQARDDIEVWRTSESQARLRSHISVGSNPNKTRYTMSQLTRDLVDDLHILKLATKAAEKQTGATLPPSQNPYLLARNLRGSYGMADTFVRSGVTDFRTRTVKIGTSLEDALTPVGGRISDFRDWIVAKRAQELMAQGRETGLLADDVAAVSKQFDANPEFQKAFQAVKVWNANVLKYAVDSGLVTPEGATAMLKMNQDYVPFHRVFEVGAGESSSQASTGTGSGLNAGKPGSLKKLTGSTREIVDPIETMVKNAYAIITASEKAAINNAVADLGNLPNMGKWVERVAAPKEQVKVSVEKIKNQLEEAGADISNLPDDLALTFYRQSGRAPFGENTIRIVRNGKPEFYRLNRDLFDTFSALDLEDSGKLIRVLASPAQLLRAGVTLEPSFAFANAMRDTFGAAVIGKYGAKPFETTLRGLGAMIGNPKLVAEWAASGGKSSIEANYFDRSKLQDFVAAKMSKDLTPAERAMIVAKSPLTALRYLTGLSEEATRIGEYQVAYKTLRKSGMPEGEARRLAAFEARDRQDFAKGGAKTKIIRHLAAFWNAGLQGNVKLFQTFKERPIRTLMQGFAYVTIPKLLEQAVNWNDPDYWDRPQWERDLFFLIPAGKDANNHTRFIRIPTPFETGVLFGTLPGRVLQWSKQNHDPKALTGYFSTLLRSTVPNPIPQSVQTIFENFLSGKQGWDVYRGRPIVPDSLANQPAELQWTEQTTALAKTVGKTFGLSPMKIDHLIGQLTGGLGKVLTGQQVPGKRFVTTPLAISNQTTQDFYDTLDTLRGQKKRFEADKSVKYPAGTLTNFESSARKMADFRRELRNKSTSEPRKTRLRELIYQEAQRAMKQYRPSGS